eukprot:gene2849-4692_t
MKLQLLLVCIFITLISANNLKLSYHEHGSVNGGGYTQFYLPTIPELTDKNKLVVVMFPLSGDAHLFVSSERNATKEHYHWNSNHTGPNFIIVKKSDPNYKTGNYFISLFGIWDTKFKVLAYISDGEEIDLHDGEPQIAESKSGEFTNIGMTNLLGWSTVYIDTEPNPTPSKHKWTDYSFGSNVYTILSSDKDFVFGENVFYYFSVYGHTTRDSIFQIAVTTSNAPEILNEGIPTPTEVYSLGYRYFEYDLSSLNGDLWIEVKPQNWGDTPYLCISNTVKQPRSIDNTCTWRAYGFDGRAHINIPKEQLKVGSFYIGVNGWPENWDDKKFTFIITAATRLRSTILTGKPISFQQKKGEMAWYRFYNGWTEESISIDATVHSGNLHMYASSDPTNTHPDKNQYQVQSVSIGNLERIRFRPYTSVEGWYYIGVEGMSNQVNYTINAYTINSINTLTLGNPFYYFGRLPENFYKIFVIDLEHILINEDLEISTHFYSGSGMIFANDKADVSNDNYIWASFWQHGLIIPKNELIEKKIKKLFIAIRSTSTSRSSFSIVTTFGSQPIQLVPGRNQNGIVTQGRYKNFVYKNGHGSRLRFVLTPIRGSGDMYIGYSRYPTSIDYDFRSPIFGPKQVVIEDAYSNTDYFISVKSRSGNFTFGVKITSDFESLDLGMRPFPDDVKEGERKIYRFMIPRYENKVMISTTLIDGETELYLSRGRIAPTRTNYTIKSTTFPANVIALVRNDTYFTPGFWTASIYGTKDSDYFIGAQTEYSTLDIGIPQSGSTSLSSTTNLLRNTYVSEIDTEKNIFFNVKVYDKESCIKVYVSQEFNKLNPRDAKWQRQSVPGYLQNQVFIGIPKADLDKDKNWIYVAVEGCFYNDDKYHNYEILISQTDTPHFLTQEITSLHAQGEYDILKDAYYIIGNFKHSNGFHMYLESCTNQDMRGFISGTTFDNATFPIRRSQTQFISNRKSRFINAIEINGDQFKNKRISLSFNTRRGDVADIYSVFSSVSGKDTRPMIKVLKSHFIKHLEPSNGKPHRDIVSIDISTVESDAYPLEFEVLGLDINSPSAKTANMETVCGIRNVNDITSYQKKTITRKQAVSFEIELYSNVAHKVNVIVKDKFGREGTSYTPVSFDVHSGVPRFFGIGTAVSFGSFIITIISISICLYLILGMIIKKLIYNSNGIEMIPHITFWKDIPILVKDGFIFLITCGKRSSSGYDDLDLNDSSSSSSNNNIIPNTPVEVNVESIDSKESTNVIGGYGSI